MDVGAIGSVGTEETDELYESKTSWMNRGVEKSLSNYVFPLEGKAFSHHTEEPLSSKRNIAPLTKMTRTYGFDGQFDVRGGRTNKGETYGEIGITIRFGGGENRTESKNRERDYEAPNNRDRDYDRNGDRDYDRDHGRCNDRDRN